MLPVKALFLPTRRTPARSFFLIELIAGGDPTLGQAIKIAHCAVRLRGKGRKCFPGCVAGETAERIDAEADALIDELGVEAYAEARRREYESSNDAIALRWNQVALAVAHKTGKRNGLDTSTRLAMNTVFVPDREHPGDCKPQPFSRADGLKGTLARRPFRLQFISLATDRGPSIVTELEI